MVVQGEGLTETRGHSTDGQRHRSGALGWLVWPGRIIGLGASALFITFFFGEGVPEVAAHGMPSELLAFAPLLLVVVGCGIALVRPRPGGWMQLVGGALMAVYHLAPGGWDDLGTALICGVGHILAGLVAMRSARHRGGRRTVSARRERNRRQWT